MATQDQMTDVINRLSNDISGFLGACIVDMETGMPLASKSNRGDFDLEVASAYNSEMVKAKNKTIKALGINSQLEDMLLTLSDQLHLIKMLSPSTFMYLAADRQSTNLALLRSAVNRETADLN
ncbi:putative regulator of Ras-like GTPase activity (Roadblock/LC7/MglB family) [Kineosphaera limosa]|uniref:Roadblock/LAMTOR2 domain-containing protein n=1 Tax=Kineosphaera limosa NBRC 100340 TaxID=1184609 RepID=K6VG19_9MICO|nr:hypothetical protein [Kineosphaera limosa]NYE02975.1 putative regulator of Ras-like GTPase activity (Roadblock/LC7/MglB family) [Kineosphaera limosa]GAB95133.1 hypothetical protein KILIM_016_00730 [Kineosphaera limosa NBRC 100340]